MTKTPSSFSTLVLVQATTLSLLLAAIHWVGAVLALGWTITAVVVAVYKRRAVK